ncbi:MAG: hypothetical protein ACLT98_12960 [Eggerthellaceae bacterium]
MKKHYKLSEREAKVMELIARRATVAHRRSSRRVGKHRAHAQQAHLCRLDIHHQTELADLVDSFDPHAE